MLGNQKRKRMLKHYEKVNQLMKKINYKLDLHQQIEDKTKPALNYTNNLRIDAVKKFTEWVYENSNALTSEWLEYKESRRHFNLITESTEITNYDQDIYGMTLNTLSENPLIQEVLPHDFRIRFGLDEFDNIIDLERLFSDET